MIRTRYTKIPLREEAKIKSLIKTLSLEPGMSPPPVQPGKTPMNEPYPWERRLDAHPAQLAPPPFEIIGSSLWIKYFVPNIVKWIWQKESLIALAANPMDGMLHRIVVRGVRSAADAKRLEAEFEARECNLTEIALLADELVPEKPGDENRAPAKRKSNFDKLKDARKKVKDLSASVRDEGFEAWVARFVLHVKEPREWTQSKVLYSNYIKHASKYGNNQADRDLSRLQLATETRFGLLLKGAGFAKVRRPSGNFYALRLKAGA